MNDDPFAVLGLPARPDLSDDDVRAAWRRIAAATHPDREDGGDPAAFGAAAAAYAILRTGWGRGEALADLGLTGMADLGGHPRPRRGRANASPGRHRAGRAATVVGPADAAAHSPGGDPISTGDAAGSRAPENAAQPGPRPRGQRDRRPRAESMRRPAGQRPRRPPGSRAGGLALRAGGAAGITVVVVVLSGWSPGLAGLLVGVLTWLLVIAGRAVARRRSRRTSP